jgi:hypothetical protein
MNSEVRIQELWGSVILATGFLDFVVPLFLKIGQNCLSPSQIIIPNHLTVQVS